MTSRRTTQRATSDVTQQTLVDAVSGGRSADGYVRWKGLEPVPGAPATALEIKLDPDLKT